MRNVRKPLKRQVSKFLRFLSFGIDLFCTQNTKKVDENKLPKMGKKNCPKRCAMFWSVCKINFQILAIFIFWEMFDFVLKFLENSDRILWTWFRNANQCYPVTSRLWGLNPKTSGAWGRNSVGSVRSKGPHEPGVSGGKLP